jgi:hypothetical protein
MNKRKTYPIIALVVILTILFPASFALAQGWHHRENTSGSTSQTVADWAQVIIALGAFVSIYLTWKAVRDSDRTLVMSTAPSVIIEMDRGRMWQGRRDPLNNPIFFQPGEMLSEISSPNPTMTIAFKATNQGRGVALNIEKPEVSANATFNHETPPPYLSIDNPQFPYMFSVTIEKSYHQWVENGGDASLEIKLKYTNDQGNLIGVSFWRGTLSVFDLNASMQLEYEGKVVDLKSGVQYT